MKMRHVFIFILVVLFFMTSVYAQNQTQIDDDIVSSDITPTTPETTQTTTTVTNNDAVDEKLDESKTKSVEVKNEDKMAYKILKSNSSTEQLNLTCDNATCYIGEVITIRYYILQDDVDDGLVFAYINGLICDVKDLKQTKDNILTLDTRGFSAVNHTIEVEYVKGSKYKDTKATSTLEIKKYPSSVENLNMTFNDENEIDLQFNIMANNTYIESGEVILQCEDIEIKRVNITNSDIYVTIPAIYNTEIIEFRHPGNKTVAALNSSQLINIPKYRTSLYMPHIRGYHGDMINITATFNTNRRIDDGYLNIYVDGMLIKTEDVKSNEVDLSFNLSEYVKSNYNITAIYDGSLIYNKTSYNTTLTVNKINTTIYSRNISSYRNEDVNITATIYNFIDTTNDGMVEFILDNESISTLNINNSKVELKYYIPDDISYGVHDVMIIYHGTQRYESTNVSIVLDVIKHQLHGYITNMSLTDSGNISFDIIFSSYNQNITDGNIKVYVNESYVMDLDVVSNRTNVVLPGSFVAGECFNVQVEYYNSSVFSDFVLNEKINISKVNTTLKISKYLTNKNILNIITYIYSKDYMNITSGSLEISLNETIICVSDVNNLPKTLEYDMTNQEIGNYTIKVKYTGNEKYAPSENITTFQYIPRQTQLTIKLNNTITTTPNKNITLDATLTNYNEKINLTIPATIKIADTTYDTQFSDGKLNYTLTIGDMDDQNITITITTNQTPYYTQATRNITLKIQRNTTYITAPRQITALKLTQIILNTTLNSNKEKLEAIIPAVVKINDKTILHTNYTDGKCNIIIPLTNLIGDNYKITIKTRQTPHHKQAVCNINLTLNKRATYIISENINSKCGEAVIINATVYDQITNKPIEKIVNVAIKINNKTHHKNTTQKAHILYQYKNNHENTYNITLISGENSIYKMSTWNGKLQYQRSQLMIQTTNIKTTPNNKINIYARILKGNKLVNTTVNVTIKINNKTITTQQIKNGIINYTYDLMGKYPANIHNITIVAGDDALHNKSMVTSNLIIEKEYVKIKMNYTIDGQKLKIKAQLVNLDMNPLNIDKIKVNIKIASKTITTQQINTSYMLYEYDISNFNKRYYEMLIQTSETSIYHHSTQYNMIKI